MIYMDEINRLCRDLHDRKASLMEELQSLPDGELYACTSAGSQRYYQRFRRTGNRKKERRIGIKRNPELLSAMVRKKYVTEAISILEKDISAAEELLRLYIPVDENSVMEGFLRKFPDLSGGIYHGTMDLQEWSEAYREENDFYAECLTSTAADGTLRRSKGELFIGAKLDQHKIPYRYEAFAHPDLPYRPDFKILRPRDRKIIFWEHLGLVNDHGYMEANKRKLSSYEDVGIVPWDNLIITYDQSDGGINEKLIDAMIQGWLL